MFQVTARTVLELGSELISSDIIAFYELIKNGIDAKSTTGVTIQFNIVLGLRDLRTLQSDLTKSSVSLSVLKARCVKALHEEAEDLYKNAADKIEGCDDVEELSEVLLAIADKNQIVVRDTGTGMSLKDLEKKFLVIGTPSRKREVTQSIKAKEKKSPYLGEKGLGRLSAMRLGGTLEVRTVRESETLLNRLKIDWTEFEDVEKMIDEVDIKIWSEGNKPATLHSGTELTIGKLESDWSHERLVELATEEFALLTNPLADMKKRPRIKLEWNGQRVKIPSLEKKLLNVAHASVWGEYIVEDGTPRLELQIKIRDLGYEHPEVNEVLKFGEADLYSLGLGEREPIPPEALVTLGNFKFQAHWFNRQRLKASGGMDRDLIRKLQRQWVGIRMYRDGFRVYPYGEDRDDWLNLDRAALMAKGYLLNKAQLIGQVDIGRNENPELIDQTNREGLRETHEQQILLNLVKESVQMQLRLAMKRVDGKYKAKRVKPVKAKTEITRLESRAKAAIRSLRLTTTNQESQVIEDLQQTLRELTELARILRERNAEVEDDAKLMQDMAGIGLLVEMVAHELARTSEHALENIRILRKSSKGEMGPQLEGLEASMKSIKARLKVLDPLSASGRQAPEKFSVTDQLTETLDGHAAQFKRHDITLNYEPPEKSVSLKTVKGYFVQVVENLIANSVYWLKLEKQKSPLFEPEITVEFLTNPVRVIVSDNGPGVDPEHQDRIFEMFFSLKESRKRRGLGLFISQSNARSAGGSLELDKEILNSSGRLSTFVYCVSENS